MTIKMRLMDRPFNNILSGSKKVEYRVNDEKRQGLKVGDTITFYLRPLEVEKIETVITDLKYYKNLLEMYEDNFEIDLKNRYDSPEAAVKATDYYTDEEIEKYGCVAIYFEKV